MLSLKARVETQVKVARNPQTRIWPSEARQKARAEAPLVPSAFLLLLCARTGVSIINKG